jgi:NitT/TauT family transport system substrate-binding protein
MMKRIFILFFSLFLVMPVWSQSLKKVTFVPHWIPQAQFAGYYTALDKGIYKKHGIDLTIITGGPKVSSSTLLKEGKVDFALMWLSNAIQLKSKGAKIVNIAQLVNRSSLMLIAKKSSGISKPEDMNGKKVGIWGGDFQIQPMAFFKKYNLNVKTIMQGNSINLFFFDGIDVTSAMWYNEYHTILNSGINKDELNTFFFSDYGLNFPEEGIYCSEDLFSKDPKLCEAFVSATLEGWQYAFQHPEEAVNIIIKYIKAENQPYNKAHQQWMLARMQDMIFPSKKMDDFEFLSQEGYKLVAEKLFDNGLIKKIPVYNELYKPFKMTKGK